MEGCDEERCPCCGGQLISCSCGTVYKVDEDMSKKELEELCKIQVTQNIASDLEIDLYINKRLLSYESKWEDGNVFFYLAKAKEILEKQGRGNEFEDLKEKVYNAKSYDEAIQYIVETLPLPDFEPNKETETQSLEQN